MFIEQCLCLCRLGGTCILMLDMYMLNANVYISEMGKYDQLSKELEEIEWR